MVTWVTLINENVQRMSVILEGAFYSHMQGHCPQVIILVLAPIMEMIELENLTGY